MKNIILSCPGREDVVRAYQFCLSHFWPDHQHDIVILDSPTDTGWNKRLLRYLNSIDDGIVFINMDDTVLNGKPDVQAVNDALGIIRSDEKIGQIMLYMRKTPECALSDGRWGSFDEQEPLFKRCILGCAFYRITFLRDILQKIVDTLTPEQDREWSGAYNFELFGGLYSKGWKVLSSMVRFWPIHTINLIAQGKVAIGAWNSVKQTGVPDEILKRGMYSHDDNPYMQKWASAPKK